MPPFVVNPADLPRPRILHRAVRMAGALALSCAAGVAGCAQVRVEPAPYGVWKEAYRISNAHTELVVVPTGGRVMRYGPRHGPNLFWENPAAESGANEYGWHNYGGDKIWIWPQDQWPKVISSAWPPPLAVDQGKYQIIPQAAGIKLISPVQPGYNVRVVRELTLAADSPRVTSRTWLEAAGTPINTPIAAWEVTQVYNPAMVLVRAPGLTPPTTQTKPDTWLDIRRLAGGMWLCPRPAQRGVKAFFPGDLVIGVTQGYALIEHILKPDYRTNSEPPLQVYSDPAHNPARPATVPSYTEFEFTSARHVFTTAQPTGPASVVTWNYEKVSADAGPDEVARQAEKQASTSAAPPGVNARR
jgi:hypothetical protein